MKKIAIGLIFLISLSLQAQQTVAQGDKGAKPTVSTASGIVQGVTEGG